MRQINLGNRKVVDWKQIFNVILKKILFINFQKIKSE
jgi:hypothetical protein